MIVVTGASGQLGRLVIENLLASVPAADIVAAVRDPARVADLAARGVQLRVADYNRPETLSAALAGADKLLLVSSSEIGQRVRQHEAVINAARQAGVGFIAYTSLLHADTSPLPLAAEHVATERLLAASGVPYAILRNGWYTENYLMGIPAVLAHGAVIGCAGAGRIASAARADYAAAAAAVLTGDGQAGKIHELAGDEAFTLAQFAEEIARQSGAAVTWMPLSEADYRGALIAAGLPEGLAGLLAESETDASKGGLYDDSRQLSSLIGRPTTSLAGQIAMALG